MLLLLHPEVSSRDCQMCQKWLYDEQTGAIETTKDGQPLARPASGVVSVPPCRQPKNSCPKGTPEAKRSLTPQNERCYQHYVRCKATNHWPRDPVVCRNAGLIRTVEDQVERLEQKNLRLLLEAALTVG
jgi:hypothetical protein